MDISDTSKRLIVALSDLHLGGHWAEGMDEKLRNYLDMLITTATEKVGNLVHSRTTSSFPSNMVNSIVSKVAILLIVTPSQCSYLSPKKKLCLTMVITSLSRGLLFFYYKTLAAPDFVKYSFI